MLILEDLARTWAQNSDLRRKAVSWTWFRTAFQEALDAAASAAPSTSDDASLAPAFFAWAESVELHAHAEVHDPLDFRHFMCGLLLQKLLASQPPVVRPAHAFGGVPDAASAGEAATRFALTLLQALRLNAGAAPFMLDAEFVSGPRWASYLENVREDSSTAIGFLDQMSGLQPIWHSPTLVEARPAMKKALARQDAAGTQG